jgi:hypothetical protein
MHAFYDSERTDLLNADRESVERIVDHLWDSSLASFCEDPDADHIFRPVACLAGSLDGSGNLAEEYAAEHVRRVASIRQLRFDFDDRDTADADGRVN